jgi:hypothetical protein
MALTHSLTLSGTKVIVTEEATFSVGQEEVISDPLYVKVTWIAGDKQNLTFLVTCTSTKTNVILLTKKYSFQWDLSGPNPIKQAYQFLKSLPEFSDATDC